MRLLLDTAIWVRSLLAPEALSATVRAALESPDAELWLSPVSVWQLLGMIGDGRVEVDGPAEAWVVEALRAVPLREAALSHEVARRGHMLTVDGVDSAGRLVLATALVYDLTLVTGNARLSAPEVRTLADHG